MESKRSFAKELVSRCSFLACVSWQDLYEEERMSSASVILRVHDGGPEDQVLDFDKPARVVVGRALDCNIALPRDYAHSDISRHHCQFEIDPPVVRVRDLGSRNGTFVNGRVLGLKASGHHNDAIAAAASELKDGDEVRVGITHIQVHLADKADCSAAYCI